MHNTEVLFADLLVCSNRQQSTKKGLKPSSPRQGYACFTGRRVHSTFGVGVDKYKKIKEIMIRSQIYDHSKGRKKRWSVSFNWPSIRASGRRELLEMSERGDKGDGSECKDSLLGSVTPK
mmetsp:Transcript_23248/g.26364  ORF Transcript_23248/g.26364 Transcript_23248/m.26364 type:complete len:120 (-) Transcript_23248:241-600(-)